MNISKGILQLTAATCFLIVSVLNVGCSSYSSGSSATSKASSTTTTTPNSPSLAPTMAAAVGYTMNTFHTGSFTTANVDIEDAASNTNVGFQWYFKQPFGGADSCHTSSCATINSDGSITISGTELNAFYTQWSDPWHGTAFGGGAYFEATLSFDPTTVNTANGWPSWWAMAIEHFADNTSNGHPTVSDQWPGMPSGYTHYIETDFFEYDTSWAGAGTYGGATHDWGGTYTSNGWEYNFANDGNTSVDNFVINVNSLTGTTVDFNQPHRYGYLWIPATATSKGSVQYFFDGIATSDKLTWTQYDCANPPAGPAGTASWTFGVLDCNHPALTFGTGTNQPMTVYKVDVWQASTAGNLTQ